MSTATNFPRARLVKPLLIGIAGGTGSGKSTITRRLAAALAETPVAFVALDSYYLDLGDMPMDERNRRNFDHPDAFDLPLLLQHLEALAAGQSIESPVYDFRRHARASTTETVRPSDVVVVDGILALHDPRIRALFGLKVFVDADADLRLARRIRRDIVERGRTVEDVLEQYETTVRPMHERFVEPTRAYADLIVPRGGFNDIAVDVLLAFVERCLRPVPA